MYRNTLVRLQAGFACLIFLCLGAWLLLRANWHGPKRTLSSPATVLIQPLGNVPVEHVAAVRAALAGELSLTVSVAAPISMPKSAYYRPRARYRAEKILSVLSDRAKQGQIILGLTARDISTTRGPYEDWGVFGLGQMPGNACVVSTFRLNVGGASTKGKNEHRLSRLTKTALHEIGHTLGLSHCSTLRCLMNDAEGSIKNTDSATEFCKWCKGKLAKY